MGLGYYRKTLPGLLGVWKAVVEQAVDDLRRSWRAWEEDVHARARAVAAAYFLREIDGLPKPVETMTRVVLQRVNGDLGDYLIADLWGGREWKQEWRREYPQLFRCLRCGSPARWQPVLSPPPAHRGKAWTWRYARPENHIPLCRRCRWKLEQRFGPHIARDLAEALWGPRFRALERLHRRAEQDDAFRPDWDLERFPLWPDGGEDWAHGSGAAEDIAPRPPFGIARGAHERALARQYQLASPRAPETPLGRIIRRLEPYLRRRRRS